MDRLLLPLTDDQHTSSFHNCETTCPSAHPCASQGSTPGSESKLINQTPLNHDHHSQPQRWRGKQTQPEFQTTSTMPSAKVEAKKKADEKAKAKLGVKKTVKTKKVEKKKVKTIAKKEKTKKATGAKPKSAPKKKVAKGGKKK